MVLILKGAVLGAGGGAMLGGYGALIGGLFGLIGRAITNATELNLI